ncbi:DnaA regulatory inactivator Hda [Paraglaciecola aquimarina]|uniref:DnaA regulatory inactivator Hda n=1 Tax=Paraglaciecola algarum TaxID=3050085 RepID=A0ABS9D961_9ALTE|nr:DnaA regulatory inactivator Hda [Paraglaciecola sp. G1-23]MCF2948932.1 DnaA regulatory inactivator Hda [Paraglaciecola sp. G1-23]
MVQVTSQLSLPVSIKEVETFESYIQGQNAQVCDYLQQLLNQFKTDTVEHWLSYLFSESEVGKSHLLYATCQQAELDNISSIYLKLERNTELTPDVLFGLEHYSLICIDDIHELEDSREWQVALFDLINRVKEQNTGCLIMTGNQPANQLPIQLPDLLSRLSWGINFQLISLTDDQRQQALIIRAEMRGMNMPKEVAKFLVNHWPRDMSSLINSLDQLDEQSLQQQRMLTIPFVKSILDL